MPEKCEKYISSLKKYFLEKGIGKNVFIYDVFILLTISYITYDIKQTCEHIVVS